MKLVVTINLDNDAFQGEAGPSELAHILYNLADTVKDHSYINDMAGSRTLRDINGNNVGSADLEHDGV